MQPHVRKALLWQIAGGMVATLVILSSLAELLWWSFYLSEPINVTRFWTVVIHGGAVISIVSLIAYYKTRAARETALLQHVSSRWDGDSGFEFHLLSYPVRVQWLFVVTVALSALFIGPPSQFLMRCGWILFGVLLHELGHAFASTRMRRRDVRITLHAFGGHTSSLGVRTRKSDAWITLAGPGIGLLAGLLVMAVGAVFETVRHGHAYDDALFVTIGWSLFNLLPIQPLDGSALVDIVVRNETLTRVLSVVTCAAGIIGAAMGSHRDLLVVFAALLLLNLLALPRVAATIESLNRRFG
jgi:hypothetical protein